MRAPPNHWPVQSITVTRTGLPLAGPIFILLILFCRLVCLSSLNSQNVIKSPGTINILSADLLKPHEEGQCHDPLDSAPPCSRSKCISIHSPFFIASQPLPTHYSTTLSLPCPTIVFIVLWGINAPNLLSWGILSLTLFIYLLCVFCLHACLHSCLQCP